MKRDFDLGDEVEGAASHDPSFTVRGRLAGITFGVNDTVVEAHVMPEGCTDGAWLTEVDAQTLRRRVDAQGFWFRMSPDYATLTIGRNDDRLNDPAWIRKHGAELLFRSMHPTHARRRTKKT